MSPIANGLGSDMRTMSAGAVGAGKVILRLGTPAAPGLLLAWLWWAKLFALSICHLADHELTLYDLLLDLSELFFALGLLAFDGQAKEGMRYFTLVGTMLTFAMTLQLWAGFDPSNGGMQFRLSTEWIKNWNVYYSLGVDGISLPLVMLTAPEVGLASPYKRLWLAAWTVMGR